MNVDLDIINSYLLENNSEFRANGEVIDVGNKNSIVKYVLVDNNGYKSCMNKYNLLYGREIIRFSKFNPYTVENIKIWLLKNCLNYTLISNTYISNKDLLTFNCFEHGIFEIGWGSIQSGVRCAQCSMKYRGKQSRLDISIVKNEFIKRGYIPMFDTYVNNASKLKFSDLDGYIYETSLSHLREGKTPSPFKTNGVYTIHNIKRWLFLNNKSIELLSDDFGDGKSLKWKCKEHGHIYDTSWASVKFGANCSVCNSTSYVDKDVNSIWKTDYWMVELGLNEEWAKSHRRRSSKLAPCKCPHCGTEFQKRCSNIYNLKTIGCPCSSDGFSYPEKIMNNILVQLGIDFKFQLTCADLKWCDKYRYDFYIPSLNTIIETHGAQHYKDNTGFMQKLSDTKQNDVVKESLANENGVHNYIVIDCSLSNIEWIKDKIMNSNIPNLMDLSKVDFEKAHLEAIKINKIKEVCERWNVRTEEDSTSTLSEIFSIHKSTISEYLKKGTSLGWCDYDAKEEMNKPRRTTIEAKHKPVEVFKDGVSMGSFNSVKELSEESIRTFGVYFHAPLVSRVCCGHGNTHKGYTFKYINKKEAV